MPVYVFVKKTSPFREKSFVKRGVAPFAIIKQNLTNTTKLAKQLRFDAHVLQFIFSLSRPKCLLLYTGLNDYDADVNVTLPLSKNLST